MMRAVQMLIALLIVAGIWVMFSKGYRHDHHRVRMVSAHGATVRGKQVIEQKNCGSCHTIPGIPGAEGVVGPPLTMFASRSFIAGELPNTPENLAKWIENPRMIEPKTAMPDLGVSPSQAQDAAAYLYTLR